MKKLLEVFIDEEGNLDLRCENESIIDRYFSFKNPKKSQSFFRRILAGMIDKMWEKRATGISKVIRLLSMAEICACAEPYAQAEEFWSTMMFNCIPSTEKYADSLKMKYGYNPSAKQRPITFGDCGLFESGMFTRKGMN